MGVAPVDYIAVAFPGNKFSGAILPEIKKLVDAGTIRVLDLVIITKDEEGNVAAIEAADAGPELAATLAALESLDTQYNLPWIALLLPVHIALALALGRRRL